MNLSIEQSKTTKLTEDLKSFSLLVDQYSGGHISEHLFVSEVNRVENVDWKKENIFNQLLAYTVLASAYCTLKCKKLDYSQAYYTNEYVYKEISYYHNVQYIVARISKEQWAALYNTAFHIYCRVYLYLANAYDHIGRFCEAQQYYQLAMLDDCNTKGVEINQGYSYANMHAFWEHEEPWIVKRAQNLLTKYSKESEENLRNLCEMVCSWHVPSFEMPKVDFSKIPNGDYESWVNENYLRINRYCDVDAYSLLSLKDNVYIKRVCATKDKAELFKTMYSEIHESFVQTRRKIYDVLHLQEDFDTEQLKMGYKNIYSILDKIAMFLSVYLDLPIQPHKVDFATIWIDKSRKNIHPKILACKNNLSLLALYNIKLDIYGSDFADYIIDEQTKDLKRIRNFLEHKFVKVQEGAMTYNDFQLRISKNEFSLNTIRLAQLVRCAIIYLCNFVMHAEYDKSALNRHQGQHPRCF